MNKVIYLGAPYSGDKAQIEQRMELFCRAVARLQSEGFFIVSPLFMHFVLQYNIALGNDWDYWKNYSRELMNRSDEFYVLCLDGWEESKGIAGEMEIAKEFGKPISLIKE